MTQAYVSPASVASNPAPPRTPEPATQNDSELPRVLCAFGDKALSQQQLLAIEGILMGHTQSAAAEYAGVSRKTLYTWRHNDADFREELQRRQEMLWETSIDRLRSMIPRAVAALKSDLETNSRSTRTRAAGAVLRLANLRSVIPMKPKGS